VDNRKATHFSRASIDQASVRILPVYLLARTGVLSKQFSSTILCHVIAAYPVSLWR